MEDVWGMSGNGWVICRVWIGEVRRDGLSALVI